MAWKSIIQKDPSRSITGRAGILHKHHIFHGTANRRLSEADGLYVMLTQEEHQKLHDKGEMDAELKKTGQRAWMEKNGKTVSDFVERYGRNYV